MADLVTVGSLVWARTQYGQIPSARQFIIIGETSRSWQITWNPVGVGAESFSVQKKPDAKGEHWSAKVKGRRWRVYLTQQELDAELKQNQLRAEENCWHNTHGAGIKAQVQRCRDIAALKRIAEIVGYGE